MKRTEIDEATGKDLKRMILVSSTVVLALVGFIFFSPIASQYPDEGVGRGSDLESEISACKAFNNYEKALFLVDSIISSKVERLPRIPFFDRYLPSDERMEAMNNRADIYDLKWKRIEILKEMKNSLLLHSALEDYCDVLGYNRDKAKALLDSLENE